MDILTGTEVKVIAGNSFETLNEFKLTVVDFLEGEDFPITVRIGDTDSFEWFNEEELTIKI